MDTEREEYPKIREAIDYCWEWLEGKKVNEGRIYEFLQTWDAKKLVIIFNEVKKVFSDEAVYGDISEFRIEVSENNLKKYIFFSAWSDEVDGNDKAVQISHYIRAVHTVV